MKFSKKEHLDVHSCQKLLGKMFLKIFVELFVKKTKKNNLKPQSQQNDVKLRKSTCCREKPQEKLSHPEGLLLKKVQPFIVIVCDISIFIQYIFFSAHVT